MKRLLNFTWVMTCLVVAAPSLDAQEHSIAREWNELLLNGIRGDNARPTVHARNLWHTSIAMYDAWAVYEEGPEPFFLGHSLAGFDCPLDVFPLPEDVEAAQEEAISYAMYRLMSHRFLGAPEAFEIIQSASVFMDQKGYDIANLSIDYQNGGPAEMGNYLASQIIAFGMQDGSNESDDYGNQYYQVMNPGLEMEGDGNPDILDPNRWQPLILEECIDQAGFPIPCDEIEFLSPEWGNVVPFALDPSSQTIYTRDGEDYAVYADPTGPPQIIIDNPTDIEDPYKSGFAMVLTWSSHLDPSDGVMIDISPASIGNFDMANFPIDYADHTDFYDMLEGGDASTGRSINPATGQAYETQMVPRGDYGRVLAEFWADGPDSETPPGHWFTILNYVNDNPALVKKWKGKGEILSDLEWDLRCYFTLGGAMHDCAISAWSLKGWHDYIRPVSAIRWMGMLGQSTDNSIGNYHPNGLPLIDGYIETVFIGDPLAGPSNENVSKIKVKAWRGPDYINNEATDVAGVDWILVEDWWPYQRPSFVTPPFAGFVSGHSTFSRGAAEVLTMMTGDEYFPGGMGVFDCPQNEFLVFEDGPSMDIQLQWATYRDASDQCSLSRIWGGIHPSADDIPGRLIGHDVGVAAFELADEVLDKGAPTVVSIVAEPNQINAQNVGENVIITFNLSEGVNIEQLPAINFTQDNPIGAGMEIVSQEWIECDTYQMVLSTSLTAETFTNIDISMVGVADLFGNLMELQESDNVLFYDVNAPVLLSLTPEAPSASDVHVGNDGYYVDVVFDEAMNQDVIPTIAFTAVDPTVTSLTLNDEATGWTLPETYRMVFDVVDLEEELTGIDLLVSDAEDLGGNAIEPFSIENAFDVDTRNPEATNVDYSTMLINDNEVGSSFTITVSYDEDMEPSNLPSSMFEANFPSNTLDLNIGQTGWLNPSTYQYVFDVLDANEELEISGFSFDDGTDAAGNLQIASVSEAFTIDTKNPSIVLSTPNPSVVTNGNAGNDGFFILSIFDEPMDPSNAPSINFPDEDPTTAGLSANTASSDWISETTYLSNFDVESGLFFLYNVDTEVVDATDMAGNSVVSMVAIDFFDIVIDSTVNVNELSDLSAFSLFPNPVKKDGELNLSFDQRLTDVQISIIDAQGKYVFQKADTNVAEGESITLNISTLASGSYFIMATANGYVHTEQFYIVE